MATAAPNAARCSSDATPNTAPSTRSPARAAARATSAVSPGRAWVNGMSSAEQTDCSYTWEQTSDGQPADAFPISSTLTYQVDWVCTGACLTGAGTLGEVDGLPGGAAIRVSERQSVVIGGNLLVARLTE